MDLSERIKELESRSRHAMKHALTEEATKTSVILPLIQTLGYDVFNLEEVIPEFVADVGLKKGEKVDFALRIGGKLAVLIEVKPITMSLGAAQFSQLYRYFAVTEARLAILTNGREVWFFSDVDEPNKVDKKPFFVFDLQAYDEKQISEFSKFAKENFSIDKILETASTIKYREAAATYIRTQLENPDDEFTKMVAKQIYEGSLTKSVLEQLRPSIQASLDEVIRDRIREKLNVAFRPETLSVEANVEKSSQTLEQSEIITTQEEIQAFMIVRAIAARVAPVDRVTMRDAKSYCSIFVDDNNRKPVCRLYFNAKSTRHIGFFNAEKSEERIQIESLSDLYAHSSKIEDVIKSYL
jgi:hypothetical protein